MLHTSMLLQPHGQKLDLPIGDVFIALTGIDGTLGTYKYYIRVPASQFNEEEHVHGVIRNHDRNQNSLRLLQKVLNDWGDTQEWESEVFMHTISESEEYK